MSSEVQTLSAEETPAAAGSSFYAAMRILPRPQREAMYHVYTFCRAADDIADNGGPREGRLAELARYKADIEQLRRKLASTDPTRCTAYDGSPRRGW